MLDWLLVQDGMDAGPELAVDGAAGHKLAAQACVDLITSVTAEDAHDPPPKPEHAPVGFSYAVHHALAHVIAARDQQLLPRLVVWWGYWRAAYTAGAGDAWLHNCKTNTNQLSFLAALHALPAQLTSQAMQACRQ